MFVTFLLGSPIHMSFCSEDLGADVLIQVHLEFLQGQVRFSQCAYSSAQKRCVCP